jgi:antitoxin VapB
LYKILVVVDNMAIHVQDEETDWLVRDFARRRGLGITAAIKTAVLEAIEKEEGMEDALARKLEPILRQVRAHRRDGFEGSDKAFMDEMWGEPE